MNEALMGQFTDKEIMDAFDHMDPRKAPGIDGPSDLFFQKNWLRWVQMSFASVMMCWRSSKNGPNKGLVIKLDMSKAYDKVEWDFLEDFVNRMGFANG
ncbi:hypothetical protein J1N35_007858 [Gossypium stocksii]|uniref:Reverse transcriptase domain-containing protein n=1 Tax=Gossypium stocksii TaxID=47602 RepID=A0A9D4AFY9_9ROSI|nr:hypothetical protein J1N35_007858 [Gossypium stocksii]